MLKSLLKDLTDPACFALSKKRFLKLEGLLKSFQTRLALPFVFRGEGHYRRIAPMQAHEEISALYNLVRDLKPKIILEIGTCHGGTLYLWCQAAGSDATIISLDLPGGRYGGGYHPKRERLYKLFPQKGQVLHLLRENSHSVNSLERVKGILKGHEVDFLFIDGDHSYEGVKRDYELYSGLVRKGGLIALHDIAKRDASTGIEVDRFWKELKSTEKNTREFLNTSNNDRIIGIGVVER